MHRPRRHSLPSDSFILSLSQVTIFSSSRLVPSVRLRGTRRSLIMLRLHEEAKRTQPFMFQSLRDESAPIVHRTRPDNTELLAQLPSSVFRHYVDAIGAFSLEE